MPKKPVYILITIIVLLINFNIANANTHILPKKEIEMNPEMQTPSFSELSYYPTFHNFSEQYQGISINTTFEIWNSGCCGLTYSLIEECDWVEVNPIYGHSYGEKDTIIISINTSNLSRGLHTCDIVIDTSDRDAVFMVNVKIIPVPNNLPDLPTITGPTSGETGKPLTFTASSQDKDGDLLWFQWDFDDGNISDWIGPYVSYEECLQTYSWDQQGSYQLKIRVKDEHDASTEWLDALTVQMPKDKPFVSFFNQLLQGFIRLFSHIIY